MILKHYETNKIDLNQYNWLLFYGINDGAKNEIITKLLLKKENILKYDEKEILDNIEIFYNELRSKSLFENKKIIVISRVTDKIFNLIEDLLEKNITETSIIINAGSLEKKSKLRILFEKKKELICVAFYPDTKETLSKLTQNFLREKKISISQSNINLLVNRCNGDRGVLSNELKKIEFFTMNKKKISTESLLKLTNLIENHSISELIDNCLAKNQKKTLDILNENTFSTEDCITINRIFLNKAKKILKLTKEFERNKNLDQTISEAQPAIFWKDKEIIKEQVYKWKPDQISQLIYSLNEIELQIKKNFSNPINIISNFILEKSTSTSSNDL